MEEPDRILHSALDRDQLGSREPASAAMSSAVELPEQSDNIVDVLIHKGLSSSPAAPFRARQ